MFHCSDQKLVFNPLFGNEEDFLLVAGLQIDSFVFAKLPTYLRT